MVNIEYTITGESAHNLPELLKKEFSISSEYSYSCMGTCHIFIFEEYYLRTNSNLISLILANSEDIDKCTIKLISGGGGTGIFSNDWGSEKNSLYDKFLRVSSVCSEKKWSIIECSQFEEEEEEEEMQCLACGSTIPAEKDSCPTCGWSYQE